MSNTENKYAVVRIDEHAYKSIGGIVLKNIAGQLEPLLRSYADAAVNSALEAIARSSLLDGGKRESLKDIIDSAAKKALEEDFELSQESMSRVLSDNEKYQRIFRDVTQQAAYINADLREIKMSGNPHIISQITSFLGELQTLTLEGK